MSKSDDTMSRILEDLGGVQQEVGRIIERINKIAFSVSLPDKDAFSWSSSSKPSEDWVEVKAEDAESVASELKDAVEESDSEKLEGWVKGSAEELSDMPQSKPDSSDLEPPDLESPNEKGGHVKGADEETDDDMRWSLERLSMLIKNNEDSPELYLRRADLHVSCHNFARAIEDYDMAIGLDSESSDYLFQRARVRKSWALWIAATSIGNESPLFKNHLMLAFTDMLVAIKISPRRSYYDEVMEVTRLLSDICEED